MKIEVTFNSLTLGCSSSICKILWIGVFCSHPLIGPLHNFLYSCDPHLSPHPRPATRILPTDFDGRVKGAWGLCNVINGTAERIEFRPVTAAA